MKARGRANASGPGRRNGLPPSRNASFGATVPARDRPMTRQEFPPAGHGTAGPVHGERPLPHSGLSTSAVTPPTSHVAMFVA